jgi:hypothetical protein
MLSGSATGSSELPLWNRLAALPRKLTYSYGSPLLPVIGLASLTLARKSSQKVLLACWGGILVAFSGADLFFNFLLKHHYFVIPVIAVGSGLFASWISQKSRWGWVPAAAFVVYILMTGVRFALSVALGQTPGF